MTGASWGWSGIWISCRGWRRRRNERRPPRRDEHVERRVHGSDPPRAPRAARALVGARRRRGGRPRGRAGRDRPHSRGRTRARPHLPRTPGDGGIAARAGALDPGGAPPPRRAQRAARGARRDRRRGRGRRQGARAHRRRRALARRRIAPRHGARGSRDRRDVPPAARGDVMTIALKRPRPHTAKSVRPAPPPPEKKTIPIVRRCLAGGEDPAVTFGVFCPAQEATVPAERCAECGFLTRFPDHATSPGAAIECTPPNMHDKTAARTSPRIDMAEAAARVPLGEVLRHRIVCVMPETSVETMMSLMIEHGLESFPVVDETWKLV